MTVPSSSQASSSALSVLQQLEKTRIQRELAIAQLLERRRQAYKLAEEREKLNWSASGGFVTTLLSALSSYHHKNLLHLLPIIPIATYLGYKTHFCYGNKVAVLEKKASELVQDGEKYSLGTISVEDVRKRIQESKIRKAEDELFLI